MISYIRINIRGRAHSWWRHQMERFLALLALSAGISPVPVNSPHKGQWRRALMFSLISAWINDWVNNREAGDLRRHRVHYDVNVMLRSHITSQDTAVCYLGKCRCRILLFCIHVSIAFGLQLRIDPESCAVTHANMTLEWLHSCSCYGVSPAMMTQICYYSWTQLYDLWQSVPYCFIHQVQGYCKLKSKSFTYVHIHHTKYIYQWVYGEVRFFFLQI